MSMMKQAFNKWRAELPNGHDVPHAVFNHDIPLDIVLQIFEAGWNAARAEARSDASQATGGRHPGDNAGPSAATGDLRDQSTPDTVEASEGTDYGK